MNIYCQIKIIMENDLNDSFTVLTLFLSRTIEAGSIVDMMGMFDVGM